ncbi:MAG: hypothetical protein M1830_004588 [Pleopsidium flavum]|nr:MAG: hypothetical protein M1830_004588 [Pleopsidium flavum]
MPMKSNLNLLQYLKLTKAFYISAREDDFGCTVSILFQNEQSCWYFATGKCSYGASCRYSHDATKKEDHGDAARWKPHRVCKYYQEGRCYKGEACTFSHESKGATGSSKSAQIPDAPKLKTAQAEDNPAFLTWRRDIPDMRRGPARRLGTVGLSQFFQTAWKMISLRDTATTPRVITSLASEGGLSRVDELSKVELDRLSLAGKRSCFEKLVLPFLRVITHKDVLSSFISENAVGTIYTFFYGANGRRAIPLLRSIGGILLTIKLESERNDEFIATSASATLAALDQLIICNQAACIEDGISEIVDIISACIGERNDHVELSLNLQAAYCHLDKIRMRMCFGNKIPSLTEKRAPASEGLASFDVGQEWPGLLSADGPRHDNDHENICDIKILPTAGEIRSHRPEYLPTTDPDKLHLAGVRGLLDRQFRLLREDTVGQLRDCVRLIMENLTDPTFQASSGKRALHGAHVFVYNHVSLSNLTFDKRKGLQITIEFEQSSAVKKMATEQARRTWWGETKQLQQDSLLCLVDSYGRSVFLSVSDRDGSRDIHEGHAENGSESALEVTATPRLGLSNHGIPSGWSQDGETPINPPPEDTGKTRPCNLWNNRERSSIAVQMVEISEKEILGILGRFKSHLHIKQALVEFPGVLVPSFRPTLQALQLMSRTLEVPFFDLLAPTADTKGAALNAVVDIPAPVYALQPDFEYDLSCITQDTVLKLSPHKRFDVLNLERQCTLDLAQCNALVSALTKSLALIQGPPGTGKSYVAVQLVNVLLAHREKADMGPIICVCYTNHALDQFLEHLLADGAQQVIRIGSQSKSEILKPLNLRLVAQEMEKTKLEKSEAYRYYKSLDEHVEEVVSLLSELKYADSAKTLKKYLEAHHTEQYYELYGYEEEEGWETVHSRHDNTIRDWLLNALVEPDTPNRDRNVPTLLKSRTYQMSSKERRVLYEHWVRDIMDMLAEKLAEAVDAYNSTKECLTRCNQELHLRCLKKAHVVGVTTSGLARNIELLRRLHSKVLLCEEAGEILEAHTLTALLPSIEHAILIGDHEQLRPQIQNYELSLENSRGLKYSLDVSLFERLIDRRHAGIQLPYETLATQRRMHPLISQLVRETLYPDLKDDTSVDDYPTVNGVRRRLFWLDHREGEAQKDPTQPNQVSHSNDYEVQMVAALVSHLVRQGIYQSDGIVVITPYVRQLQKIRRILSESNELHVIVGDRDQEELEKQGLDDGEISKTLSRTRKTTLLKSLKVATVDNFQGEEADVVVVSLVRSNEERRCGFLATSNRINVLLSRARHGLYIIGNAETSGHVPMWAKVISILKKANNFGPKLALCCPRHPSTSIQVSTPDDFSRLAPEGGCSLNVGTPAPSNVILNLAMIASYVKNHVQEGETHVFIHVPRDVESRVISFAGSKYIMYCYHVDTQKKASSATKLRMSL